MMFFGLFLAFGLKKGQKKAGRCPKIKKTTFFEIASNFYPRWDPFQPIWAFSKKTTFLVFFP
jgi:hypothetical protein